jgi:hypothetical protein
VTESALTTAALVQYMDGGGVDEKLVVRRLDGLTQAVAHLQYDLDVLGVAFGGFAWRSFIAAQASSIGSVIKLSTGSDQAHTDSNAAYEGSTSAMVAIRAVRGFP